MLDSDAASTLTSYRRYVALGDSMTEGIGDPDGYGGWRGWADRLAERLAASGPPDPPHGEVLYANLAIRGRRAGQVRAEQLRPAVAMNPDLATVVAGMNDVLRLSFDAGAVAHEVEAMQAVLVAAGAVVVTFTVPDPAPVMPLARVARGRIAALNDALRAATARTGAILVDVAAQPVASDPRLWSADRMHANAAGHERIAAALAAALGLPGSDGSWAEPLPGEPRRGTDANLATELVWLRQVAAPWLLRRLQGRSSGDGVVAKRQILAPVVP
ncbi:MAG: SGNH/GDSL hydrolase family protein [Frankia sp.]